MHSFSMLDRRRFLGRTVRAGALAALSAVTDFPWVVRRALGQSPLGRNGKKLLFIFLRGGNDSLNSIIPVGDEAYGAAVRPDIFIPRDPATDYGALGPCDFPASGVAGGVFDYRSAIRLGNGFAALHPSLKFLAPVYNAGQLAILHRVGYPRQSRSHFDSEAYWETGSPNVRTVREGILYRAILESGAAATLPITGVSFQTALPLMLRGPKLAMTNLSATGRYSLQGIPNSAAGNAKAITAIHEALEMTFPEKRSRDLLQLQYENYSRTLAIFSALDFSEAGNTFRDSENTDGDSAPYYLFPTVAAKNGGSPFHSGLATKEVVPGSSLGFFERLKAAAIVLNKTSAVVTGTELSGFDTHVNQGGLDGNHANLQRIIGWSIYALQRYFTQYADQAAWKDVVVVTLSEFGRTTVQNSNGGTDHAEGGAMLVAGGSVQGYGRHLSGSGAIGISPSDQLNGNSTPWIPGRTGTMFGMNRRYLKRALDYRSVLGELIRDHLGASPEQLGRILPGYADPAEHLEAGGTSDIDGVPILGEVGLI